MRIAMPPSFTTTFGDFADARIEADQPVATSSRLPAYEPIASGPPTWFRQIRVSGNACASAVSSSIWG